MKVILTTNVKKLGKIGDKVSVKPGYARNYKEKNMSEIQDQVKKIVVDHLGIDESKVVPEAKFIDDLGADSLDTVELVMAFEEEFGSEISDSEAEKILTVGDAVKFIEGKAN